jgi:hypothetical protein
VLRATHILEPAKLLGKSDNLRVVGEGCDKLSERSPPPSAC